MSEQLASTSEIPNQLETAAPERPTAEVVADEQARQEAVHALEAEHAAQEDPERRCADIKLWVEAECDYFVIEPKNDPVADQITKILFRHEQERIARGRPYDVTAQEPARLNRVIERAMALAENHTEAMQDETEAAQDEAETSEARTNRDSYSEAIETLSGLSNSQKIQALLTTHRNSVPEDQIPRLEAYQAQINQVKQLGSTPEARAFVTQAIESQPMKLQGGSPAQVFSGFLRQIETGVASGAISEADAASVRTVIGVPSHAPAEPYKVPSDPRTMAKELSARRQQEQQVPVMDPETGEPMRDDEGNIIYETKTIENNDPIPIDHPFLEITMLPEPESDAYLVHVKRPARPPLVERVDANNFAMNGMQEMNYLLATADLEQQGYVDVFGPPFTDNAVRRKNYERFIHASGLDPDLGQMWTTEHSDRIRQIMQMLHPRADLGREDVEPARWQANAKSIGLFDPQSQQWDYDALRRWRNKKLFDTVGKDGAALKRSGQMPV